MIAATHELDINTVTHGVNGPPTSTQPILEADVSELIRSGTASIGNCSGHVYRKGPELAFRNLNGSMDETLLFSVVPSYRLLPVSTRRGSNRELPNRTLSSINARLCGIF